MTKISKINGQSIPDLTPTSEVLDSFGRISQDGGSIEGMKEAGEKEITTESLVMFPSGYKATKLYSQLSNDGVGDFDVSRGSVATRFNQDGLIEEVGNDVPRIDFTDGEPSLLLEPQSTNIQSNSEPISTGAFNANIIFQPTSIYGKNGLFYGDNSVRRVAYFNVTTDGTSRYTFSVFILMTDGSQPSVGATGIDDFNMIILGNSSTEDLIIQKIHPDYNIYKCSVSRTAVSTSTTIGIEKTISNSNKTFEVTGYQLEALPYPTSYIKTTGSTGTRIADVCNNAGDVNTFNSEEGVLYAEIAKLNNEIENNQYISISDGSNSNSINIYQGGGGVNTNRISVDIRVSGVVVSFNSIIVSDVTNYNKIAYSYKFNEFKLFVNGNQIGATDTSGNIFPINTLNELAFERAGFNFYGKCKQLRIFKTSLTDLELQNLTT